MVSARGPGFTDDEWAQFNDSQAQMAAATDRAMQALGGYRAAMASGAIMTPDQLATRGWINQSFGKSNDNPDALNRVYDNMQKYRPVLEDNPAAGYAYGLHRKDWNAKFPEGKTAAQATPHGKREVWVNLDHDDFSNQRRRTLDTGHEKLHSDPALQDQRLDPKDPESGAYRFDGNGFNYNKLKRVAPERTILNPDNYMEFVERYLQSK
jgi:hypothetical protein